MSPTKPAIVTFFSSLLDDQIGLKSFDEGKVYIACVSGELLDLTVNNLRTAFELSSGELESIKRSIAATAREYLHEFVQEVIATKVHTITDIMTENPQFLFIKPEIKKFAEGLQANTFRKEDVFVEMSRYRFRRQKTFINLANAIKASLYVDAAIREKVAQYSEYIETEKKGALAEYVTRRKAVLDIFEQFLGYTDDEAQKYEKEAAVHTLMCPMRTDSNKLQILNHNLWMIDDRLAFFNYFASDIELRKYSNSDSDERPDLTFFYDACIAWRQAENADTVVIVEFKKPMREDYSTGKDPVQQVLGYVQELRTRKDVLDVGGRPIYGVGPHTAFHCYIVADLTPALESRLIGRFDKTPDGKGFFGYTRDPAPAFVEIIPYGKLLNDARIRNTIFFQELGITNTG